ncbi:hypothetical protein PIB30_020105 [Stylosanthes scabra]|uniref:Dirigent protein n=1 Tax=Stylosanthes scabra TaxID=79078 RepID=A0ABU6WAF2_9FABA|nr:hypothetical protein [Stylosanthes scabra]
MTTYKTLFSILFILLLFSSLATSKKYCFDRTLSTKSLGLRKEKLSHLHFYFHDIVSGQNPTVVRVAQAPITNKSLTLFGAVMMADDPLTVGPEPNSKFVEKAQEIYASASQNGLGLLMVLNFVFKEGKYNGSTMSLLGRNAAFSRVREMPIVGGSGVFQFARGYAKAKTFWLNTTSGDATELVTCSPFPNQSRVHATFEDQSSPAGTACENGSNLIPHAVVVGLVLLHFSSTGSGIEYEHENKVLETRKQIESRNPLALLPKIVPQSTDLPSNNMEDAFEPIDEKWRRTNPAATA